MKRLLAVLLSLTLAVSALAGCAKTSTATSAASSAAGVGAASMSVSAGTNTACPSDASGFAKTKFLAHTALGFGAFHRYIYKPLRAGGFKSGAHGRLRAFLKAGAAALFVKREVRLAAAAAQHSPALCKVILTPLRTISETVQNAVAKLRGGDTSGIGAVQGAISAAKSHAAKQGTDITENANAPLN